MGVCGPLPHFSLNSEKYFLMIIDDFSRKAYCIFLTNQRIKAERINVYLQEQKNVSECFNYIAMDAVKAMLNESKLKENLRFKPCSALYAPGIGSVMEKILKLCLNYTVTKKSSVKHLKAFGSVAYIRIPKPMHSKPQMQAKKGIF